jgi:hypothetical protein
MHLRFGFFWYPKIRAAKGHCSVLSIAKAPITGRNPDHHEKRHGDRHLRAQDLQDWL